MAGIGMLILAAYVVIKPTQAFLDYIDSSKLRVEQRKLQLVEITDKLNRYQQLKQRLTGIKATFEKSQLSFESVTRELDKMMKDIVGTNDYTLSVGGSPLTVGEQFERQDFSLNVRGLTAKQIVDLLYNLQEGETPLFLGKVDLVKSSGKDSFNATLEIFSVGNIKS